MTYDIESMDPYSKNPSTLNLASNEFVNSVAVYSNAANYKTTPELPDVIFTTNLGNSVSCGQPISFLKREELLSTWNHALTTMIVTVNNPAVGYGLISLSAKSY